MTWTMVSEHYYDGQDMRYPERSDYERDAMDYLHRSTHALESISRHLYYGTQLLKRLVELVEDAAEEHAGEESAVNPPA